MFAVSTRPVYNTPPDSGLELGEGRNERGIKTGRGRKGG